MKSRIFTWSMVALVLTLIPSPGSSAYAAMLTVPGDKSTIQSAVDAAINGDTVLVAPGTFKENINFKGKAITVSSTEGPDVTIIDGNQAGSVVTFSSGETTASVLDGFSITNGAANYSGGYVGGGINISGASPTISNNRIFANSANYGHGGGIAIWAGSPIIRGNVISRNLTGGGIWISGGSAQILDNEISDNASDYGGGIVLFSAESPTIRGNVIAGNNGNAQGGGISIMNPSNPLIVQNVIANNRATSGGGIYWGGTGGPYLLNNTIIDNDASQGSGIFAIAGNINGNMLLLNNIIVGKSGQTAIFCGGDNNGLYLPEFNHNLVYSPSGPAYGGNCTDQNGLDGNITADPHLTSPLSGHFSPLAGSPAIDGGSNTVPSLPATDMDGSPRILDGNGDGIASVDIGAYEFDRTRPVAVMTGAPSGATSVNSVNLTIAGAGVVSYRYSVDGNPFSPVDIPVATPLILDGLANRRHTVAVIGKDSQGREQLVSFASVATWIVDTIPPVTSVSMAGATYPGSISVTLSCNDGSDGSGCGTTLYCLGSTCIPSLPYDGGIIGIVASTHLRFFSTDKANNSEAVKVEEYAVIFPDTVPPTIDEFTVPSTYSRLTLPVTLTASDNVGVTGYCLSETSDPAVCVWSGSAPTAYTFATTGPHTLYAFVRDRAGNVSAQSSAAVTSAPNFVSAPGSVDMVYDGTRDILYVTSGDSVLRYRLASQTYLSPYKLGGRLSGIDLSPDGNTLAVADNNLTGIHLIDLLTDTHRQVAFTPVTSEGGSYSVAFGGDGSVLVSARCQCSGGWMPLRRYDPRTGEVKVIANIEQDSMLAGSADGKCIGYVGGNTSSGPISIYDVTAQKVTHTANTGWSTAEIGASRDCSQFAVPTYGGTFILDGFLKNVTRIGEYAEPHPVGVVYHPGKDIVYFSWTGTSDVRAFDTNTFTQLATYDLEDTFEDLDHGGRLKISRDGTILFATVKDGVRFQRLPVTPAAENQSVVTGVNRSVAITLTGSSPVKAELSYRLITLPAHGTLTGTAPDLIYTPAHDYNGPDSFTFRVSDGTAESATATVAIDVNDGVSLPAITSFVLPATSSSTVVPVLTLTTNVDTGVAEYCLNESNEPLSTSCSWTSSVPASFGFYYYGPHKLYAFVRDAAGHISKPAIATVVISLPNSSAPTITGFSVPTTFGGMTVPVALTASDGVGVTGYCLAETADLAGCVWSSSAPTSYTLSSYGPHTLYGFAMNAAGSVSAPASAITVVTGVKNFIPAPERRDMVYDSARDLVYMTSGGEVLRYRLSSSTFLPPYRIGGYLSRMDLSPDGNTLAIADSGIAGIHLIDLQTGTVKPDIMYTPGSGERGSFAVAYGNDGALLVSSSSPWTPLRRIDPLTGVVTIFDKPSFPTMFTENTVLSGSADGRCIGYAESDISSGPLGIYDVASQRIARFLDGLAGTQGINYEIGTNRDCTQFAVVSESGAVLFDGTLNRLTKFGQYPSPRPMGAVYHPASDIVFFSWAGTREVRAYDSNTFSQLAVYDFERTFEQTWSAPSIPGRLRISRDGSILFATVQDGVRYQRITDAPVADDQSIEIHEDASVTITLTASSPRQTALTYTLTALPTHGTLSGTAPNLTFIPDAGYNGRDNFTFRVSDGNAESALATVTINVKRDATPPVIDHFSIRYYSSSLTVPVTIFSASDDVGVVSYCLTEVMSSADCSWSVVPPLSYTFSGSAPAQGTSIIKYLYAFARDAAGNISNPASCWVGIAIPDTTAPKFTAFVIPVASSSMTVPMAAIATDSIGVTGYCVSETGSSEFCSWSTTAPTSYNFSSLGSKTLYAWAMDAAGNRSDRVSATTTITLQDVTSPTLLLSTLTNDSVTSNPVLNIAGTANDSSGVVQVTINGVTVPVNPDGTFSNAVTLQDGINTVMAVVDDSIGNRTVDTRTITFDRAAPLLTVTAPADNSSVSRSFIDVTGTVSENSTATVNGGSAAINGTTFSATVHLAAGLNTIVITATDLDRNTSSAKRTVTFDSGAPSLAITEPAQDIITTQSGIAVSGTVADALTAVTVTVSVDGQSYAPPVTDGNFSQLITFTTQEFYAVVVTATDMAGKKATVQRNILYSNPSVAKQGDCDDNGSVSIAEVQSAINMFLGLKQVVGCVDVDNNSSVSIAEVQKTINSFLGL